MCDGDTIPTAVLRKKKLGERQTIKNDTHSADFLLPDRRKPTMRMMNKIKPAVP